MRHQGRQNILVVDDEEGVIEAVRETLHDTPYKIIATTNPAQALERLRSDDAIDLLITDVFMPEMDGETLLRESRRIRPELKAVLLTGAASEEEFRKWRGRGQLIVWKPWTEAEFLNAVNRALDHPTNTEKIRRIV